MKRKLLSELYIYPVKSCKGMSLRSVNVGPKGPAMDRRWMAVDRNGRFLSQRSIPKMALIHVHLDDSYLFLSAPGMTPLMLKHYPEGTPCQVVVWNDNCTAHDMGDDAAKWISDYLQIDSRLVFLPDDSIRRVNPEYSLHETDQLGFAEAFPFLLISEASLEDLSRRVGMPLRMNRFRPNLVISNCEPYEEDTWKVIQIGKIIFHLVKPCSRCIVTTINQERAEVGSEPLLTLASFRKGDDKVYFGQNCVHVGSGSLEVGTEISILEKK
ncbi:MAG: MOSC domain-containing protein [Verrucomicrobia bacterium]|nr:MOSC domain-containing protein [Verrucomicrobiota bacterium]